MTEKNTRELNKQINLCYAKHHNLNLSTKFIKRLKIETKKESLMGNVIINL